MPQREQTDQPSRSCGAHSCPGLLMRHHLRPALDGQAVNCALRSRGVKFRVAEFVSQPVSLSLVQRLLSEVGFGPSAASVEHVNGPTLPVISRSYVYTEFHGSLNSPVVNFADSNESLPCSPSTTAGDRASQDTWSGGAHRSSSRGTPCTSELRCRRRPSSRTASVPYGPGHSALDVRTRSTAGLAPCPGTPGPAPCQSGEASSG